MSKYSFIKIQSDVTKYWEFFLAYLEMFNASESKKSK